MGPLETQFVHVWEQRCIFLQQNNLEFQYLSSTGTGEKKFGMIFNSPFFSLFAAGVFLFLHITKFPELEL